jgi:N-carbamoyl-L-amino-acid hydrolase
MHRRTFLGNVGLAVVAPLVRVAPARATPVKADGTRVNRALAAFDAIGRTAGGINRVAYSEADLAGRTFTLDLFRRAGLTPRLDAAGNIVGRLEGAEPALPPIVIGSHIDSVTDGGNFDGPVGSFGAVEVARSLREQGVRLRHPLEAVAERGGRHHRQQAGRGVAEGRRSRRRGAIRQDPAGGRRAHRRSGR